MKKLINPIISMVLLFVVLNTSLYAWYTNYYGVNTTDEVLLSSNAAYFAGGDGSEDNPYIINEPRHLYNLAWLQDLGYFNDSNAPYYFEITDNLDMSELKSNNVQSPIPPIGIDEYPFIGVFVGDSKIIDNLYISTDFSNSNYIKPSDTVLNKHTETISGSTIVTASVGFFGIIGEESSSSSNTNSTTVTPSASYFYLDNVNIESTVTLSTVGLLAGSVYGNLSYAGVCYSKLTLSNSVTSNYTLVGKYDESSVSWTDKPGESGVGYGSSLDVGDMINRLYNVYTNTLNNILLESNTLSTNYKNYHLPVVKATNDSSSSNFKINTSVELKTLKWSDGTSTKSFMPISINDSKNTYTATESDYESAGESISNYNVGFLVGNETKLQRSNFSLSDTSNFYKMCHDSSLINSYKYDLDDIPANIKEALGTYDSSGKYSFNEIYNTIQVNKDIDVNNYVDIWYGSIAYNESNTIKTYTASESTPIRVPYNCIWFCPLISGTASIVLTPDEDVNQGTISIAKLQRSTTNNFSSSFTEVNSNIISDNDRIMLKGYVYYYTFEIEAGYEYAIYNMDGKMSQILYLDIGTNGSSTLTYTGTISNIDFVYYSGTTLITLSTTGYSSSDVYFVISSSGNAVLYFKREEETSDDTTTRKVHYYCATSNVITPSGTTSNSVKDSTLASVSDDSS